MFLRKRCSFLRYFRRRRWRWRRERGREGIKRRLTLLLRLPSNQQEKAPLLPPRAAVAFFPAAAMIISFAMPIDGSTQTKLHLNFRARAVFCHDPRSACLCRKKCDSKLWILPISSLALPSLPPYFGPFRQMSGSPLPLIKQYIYICRNMWLAASPNRK